MPLAKQLTALSSVGSLPYPEASIKTFHKQTL